MRTSFIRMSAAILLCSLAVATMSCSDKENPRQENTPFQQMLSELDWGTDTCYIYGHKTPDVDAVTSALAYAKLMRALGYNCVAKVSSPMNRETEYIARVFGIELPALKDSVTPQTRLILTDHTDYAQCVDGARQAVILQKIDHHVEGDIREYDDVEGCFTQVFGHTAQKNTTDGTWDGPYSVGNNLCVDCGEWFYLDDEGLLRYLDADRVVRV